MCVCVCACVWGGVHTVCVGGYVHMVCGCVQVPDCVLLVVICLICCGTTSKAKSLDCSADCDYSFTVTGHSTTACVIPHTHPAGTVG